MHSRILYVVTLGLTAPAASVLAQRDFSDVTIKATHVAGSFHMLEGACHSIILIDVAEL